MKKLLLYSVAASVLGLLLILGPLIALAAIKAENHYGMLYLNSASEQLKKLERTTYGSDPSTYSGTDLEVLAISCVIALVVYVLVKRRLPHHDYRWIKRYPY